MKGMNELESRAKSFADELSVQYEWVQHKGDASTTLDAAKLLLESPENIIKCLILEDVRTNHSVGVIVRGDARLDMKLVRKCTGANKLRFASPDYIRDLLGFDIGGIPPFSIVKCHQRLFCKNLLSQTYVIGAGGHSFCGMKFAPTEILKIPEIQAI